MSWKDQAICKGLTDLFFADSWHDVAKSKRVCSLCPVKQECFNEARDTPFTFGVWGGSLWRDGKNVDAVLPQGRPPKDGWQAARLFEGEET